MFQIFEKVKNLRFRRGCRAVVGKGSFSLNLTDGSLEKVARMHQFLWRFPRTVRLCWRQIGGKLLKTIGNRFETLHLADLLWPRLVKDMGKFPPMEIICLYNILWQGMKHHWEWVITRLHGVNAHIGGHKWRTCVDNIDADSENNHLLFWYMYTTGFNEFFNILRKEKNSACTLNYVISIRSLMGED